MLTLTKTSGNLLGDDYDTYMELTTLTNVGPTLTREDFDAFSPADKLHFKTWVTSTEIAWNRLCDKTDETDKNTFVDHMQKAHYAAGKMSARPWAGACFAVLGVITLLPVIVFGWQLVAAAVFLHAFHVTAAVGAGVSLLASTANVAAAASSYRGTFFPSSKLKALRDIGTTIQEEHVQQGVATGPGQWGLPSRGC